MQAIGIDIGGTHIRAALVSTTGQILARATSPSAPDPTVVLSRCLDLIAQVRSPDCIAIGIGIPGQVIAASRSVLSGGYVDLSGQDFALKVENATGLPVTIENDATMALLGEVACGAATGALNAVMLTIGTGIGGAIISQGKVLRGTGTAGQLGHIVVDPDGLPCVCGRTGCVETTSSGTAFGHHLVAAGLPPDTRAEHLLARDDAQARAVLDAWAGPLRQAIDTLITMCNPQVVVIGGGAGASAVAALALRPAAKSWFDAPILAAQLGDDAGVIGAALAALPRSKRVILVNGVPASGKSVVADAVSVATGWPILRLDTIKDPFLRELAPVDRNFNRRLGRASYASIFNILADAPGNTTTIVDAWFGFQPAETLTRGLTRAGVSDVFEIWCHAPPDVIGDRYAARIDDRPAGHPGAEYVSELITLAARAQPMSIGPVHAVDTTTALDLPALLDWLHQPKGPAR